MSNANNQNQSLAWIGITVLLCLGIWFGMKAMRDAKPEQGPAAPGGVRPPSTVIYREAAEQEMVETIRVTGSLRAVRRADVAARESGAVESLTAEEGDTVKEGEPLATVDGRRLETQLAEAEAELIAVRAELTQRQAENDRARQDEEMMRKLWEQKAIAEREYLDSLRGAKVALARQNAADEAIAAASKRRDLLNVRTGDLSVKAPFSGRVVARHTELGEWLKEGDPVVTIVSTGEVEAWLQLPERHVAALRLAKPESVELTVPGRSEPLVADKLSLVPDVDGRSRRFTLIAHIPDPDNTLTPGSSVEATVPIGQKKSHLVVPSDAVLKSYSGSYVFTAASTGDGPPLATQVPVEILFERSGIAVIAPGALKPGDHVIVEGNERLFPNTPVAPQAWEDTRATPTANAN